MIKSYLAAQLILTHLCNCYWFADVTILSILVARSDVDLIIFVITLH